MTPLVPITIFGWPLVVLVFFTLMPPRRAVIVSMLGAWMFLPMAGFKLTEGIPEVNKMLVTCLGVFLGAAIFDAKQFSRLRWSVADLAMAIWILAPMPSAIQGGYGAYEGFSNIFNQIVSWGMPYLIGRMYFSDFGGLRELAVGMFVGGLIYVPFVLFEARMSPQLHTWVYGFHQHDFSQSKRGDSWRPTVFMQHGLAVAMFMGTAAVCGMWLWTAGKVRVLLSVPVWALACGLFGTAAACRSTYALVLMLSGLGALFAGRALKTRIFLCAILSVPPLYVGLRTVGGWDAQEIRDFGAMMGNERSESLEVRLQSEDALWKWIQGDAMFGRGRLVDLMIADREEYGRFIPDGLWLIALGKYGFVGLTGMLGVLLVPSALYLRRLRPQSLMSRTMAGPTVLTTVLVLYAMDNLLNAMVNPIFLLAAGGIAVCRAPEADVGLERAMRGANHHRGSNEATAGVCAGKTPN